MLDFTKANEFASQCGNDVLDIYSEVKSCLNVISITFRIVLLLCVSLFRVQ